MPIVVTIRQFDDYSVSILKQAINDAQKNNQKVLPVAINSPGGSVYKLFEMVDLLNASGLKIVTTVNGIAMSAGAYLFIQGEERFMSENSTIMIHDASYFGWGKHSEIKSLSNHIDGMNKKFYEFCNKKSGKPDGYYEDLVAKNNGADLFLNAQEALKHGFITAIKVPDINELMSLKDYTPVNSSTYERTKVFMQMSDEYESNIDAKTSLEIISDLDKKPKAHKSKTTKEVKNLNLEELLAMLTAEQKIPLIELQKDLSNAKASLTDITQKLTEKETELSTVKQSYEIKINDLVANQDKDFMSSLIANHQISKADAEKEIKMLASLSIVPEAKQAYKEKLTNAPKIVEGEIPANGERNATASVSNNDIVAGIIAYAEKNKININEGSGYQKARAGYLKSIA